jgi:hypothetical protein
LPLRPIRPSDYGALVNPMTLTLHGIPNCERIARVVDKNQIACTKQDGGFVMESGVSAM